MARLLFLLFSAFIIMPLMAEVTQIDTIYYDKEWKGVSSPHFASYYRIIEKNPADNNRKVYRDYYITGELQCEGNYLSIDRNDDTKSVMDGELTSYFRSGKIEQKETIINGKREGEFIRFFENGSIAVRANFCKNQLHGLYTEFNETGLCFQQEFWRGTPEYDYYIVTNDKGLYSKLRSTDNTPIYTSPSISQMKIEYVNGQKWPYYIQDGLMIAMNNTRTNDYGKYYRVYVNITNNSFYPIEFDPNEVVAILTDKKGSLRALEVQTAQQYDKRIKRTQRWEEALVGVANGLAASNAGYSTSTTTTNYIGSSYSSGSTYGAYNGMSNYYGGSISTTRTYDAAAAYQAQLAASQQMAALSEDNFHIREARQEGYLRRTTINPGESISGYFNIKRKDGESLNITFNIAGAKFTFPWNVKK